MSHWPAVVSVFASEARKHRHHKITVEGHIGGLVAFYRAVIARAGAGTAAGPARLHSRG